jgi:hypothetical protein
MKRLLFILFLGAWMPIQAQEVEALLDKFDKKADAETANQFFDVLLKEAFMDEKVVFSTDTPLDSLQQQVWYWAAEWLYDQQ